MQEKRFNTDIPPPSVYTVHRTVLVAEYGNHESMNAKEAVNV